MKRRDLIKTPLLALPLACPLAFADDKLDNHYGTVNDPIRIRSAVDIYETSLKIKRMVPWKGETNWCVPDKNFFSVPGTSCHSVDLFITPTYLIPPSLINNRGQEVYMTPIFNKWQPNHKMMGQLLITLD